MRKLLFLLTLSGAMLHCTGERPKDTEQILNAGLQIENDTNRGVNYTDPQGIPYSIRYIPITITNDTTIALELHIAFGQEYDYPTNIGTARFHVIPLPEVWGMDGVGITDSLFDELPRIMEKPVIAKTLRPGEKWLFAIGTVYPRPVTFSGVLPNALFTAIDKAAFSDCEWLVKEEQLAGHQIALGLKLTFGKDCRTIPGGHISYVGD